jgi:hypothetical protein
MGGAVDGLLQQRFRSLRRLGSAGIPPGYDPALSCRGTCSNRMTSNFVANQVFRQFDEILKVSDPMYN